MKKEIFVSLVIYLLSFPSFGAIWENCTQASAVAIAAGSPLLVIGDQLAVYSGDVDNFELKDTLSGPAASTYLYAIMSDDGLPASAGQGDYIWYNCSAGSWTQSFNTSDSPQALVVSSGTWNPTGIENWVHTGDKEIQFASVDEVGTVLAFGKEYSLTPEASCTNDGAELLANGSPLLVIDDTLAIYSGEIDRFELKDTSPEEDQDNTFLYAIMSSDGMPAQASAGDYQWYRCSNGSWVNSTDVIDSPQAKNLATGVWDPVGWETHVYSSNEEIFVESNDIDGVVPAFGTFYSRGVVLVPNADNRGVVIIVPGIFGSWSTELFCGDSNSIQNVNDDLDDLQLLLPNAYLTDYWSLDPIRKTYDPMVEDLRDRGFRVVTFPYDWRKPIESIALDLRNKIELFRAAYQAEKVHVVAHSMGGLVTRMYLQSTEYQNDIDKFVMIGTPNLGSVDAYWTWQAGKFKFQASKFFKNSILANMRNGCDPELNPSEFVRSHIPSVEQLLPVFQYANYEALQDDFVPKETSEMCYKNNFLPQLNQNANVLADRAVDIKIIASSNRKTIEAINISKAAKCSRSKWPDGKPVEKVFSEIDRGDGVVIIESAYPIGIVPVFSTSVVSSAHIVNGKHSDLPKKNAVIKSVRKFLKN